MRDETEVRTVMKREGMRGSVGEIRKGGGIDCLGKKKENMSG